MIKMSFIWRNWNSKDSRLHIESYECKTPRGAYLILRNHKAPTGKQLVKNGKIVIECDEYFILNRAWNSNFYYYPKSNPSSIRYANSLQDAFAAIDGGKSNVA